MSSKAMSKKAKKRAAAAAMASATQNGQVLGSAPSANNSMLDEIEEEAMVVAETYAEYWPAKLKFGKKHPDAVVETASLSSVSPTDITYKLALPESVIEEGKLSALQLESIIYASQAHEQLLPDGSRAGFLIGDGAGVGKGRTVAGIIYESYMRGRRKAIWISVSADLVEDSKRDLRDIGARRIQVYNLSKFKYSKIDSKENGYIKEGVIFSTYSSLISKQSGKNKTRLKQLVQWCGPEFDGCIIFDECHKAKHLVPTGSTKPTQTGQAVLALQDELPNARIVYASATGASEPRNMAYMVRLGLWGDGTQFKNFGLFLTTVEKRGVGAMEVVAMDMKLRGMYIARQLSFQNVTFEIQEVPFDDESEKVYNDSVDLWVEAYRKFKEASELLGFPSKSMWGQFWGAHQRFFKYLCIATKVKHAVKAAENAIADEKCVVIGLQSTGEARTLEEVDNQGGKLTDFISTAKAVFESLVEKQFPTPDLKEKRESKAAEKADKLLVDSKPTSSKRTTRNKSNRKLLKRKSSGSHKSDAKRPRIEDGSIVISDSESNDDISDESDYLDDIDFDDLDAFDEEVDLFRSKYDRNSGKDENENLDPAIDPATAEKVREKERLAIGLKAELLAKIRELGKRLPTNTLDNLVDLLGGPTRVAELTGRKGRVVRTYKGVRYESRAENDVSLEKLNLVEKDRFMKGEKLIAIISEAASNGISLQSDRRVQNKRRRVHITLELPWSADRAIQQFGRTHRANQVSAPEYIFLISNLAGERRFAASVAKRLESLGALTHADRRATDTRDLSQFNVDNKYGRSALRSVYNSIIRGDQVIDGIPAPKNYDGNFFKDASDAMTDVGLLDTIEGMTNARRLKDSDKSDIAKFLNRILGLKVKLQNHLFDYFTDTMDANIEDAKRAGGYDLGITDMGNANNVKLIDTKVFLRVHATGIAPIELHTVEFDRGITFEEAMEKYSKAKVNDIHEGFYLSDRYNHKTATLAMYKDKASNERFGDIQMQIYRPNIGMLSRSEKLSDMRTKNDKVTPSKAEAFWKHQYDASEKTCTHNYWWGFCKAQKSGVECDFGLRKRQYYVVAGSIFAVWSRIEQQIRTHDLAKVHEKLKVIRLQTVEGRKIVGVLVPKESVDFIIEDLESDSASNDK